MRFQRKMAIIRNKFIFRVVELADKYSNGNKCAGLAISGDLTWQSQAEDLSWL